MESSTKPRWLKRKVTSGPVFNHVHETLKCGNLHTVCEEALCPNLSECFSRGTATFLILGDICTRNCRFCAVNHGNPSTADSGEPDRIAEAIASMKLKYAVITSVTRDDMADGGASIFAETIVKTRAKNTGTKIEVLIPDFQGSEEALSIVLDAAPDVLNHNVETVPRLYPVARPQADYKRSLELLARSHKIRPDIPVKSGVMLGMGETASEIEKTLRDLLEAHCSIITLGQYLQPSKAQLPVERFVTPEEFAMWGEKAKDIGFKSAVSGPFVRSSYNAGEYFSLSDNK